MPEQPLIQRWIGLDIHKRNTSLGHKLRIFEELKTQGEERIKFGFVSRHGFFQAL